MLNKIKQALKLNPKSMDYQDIKVTVGVSENKLVIKLNKKIDTVTFTKEQLSKFLSAVASTIGSLK